MKQVIVLVAMIVLGVAIAGMVTSYKSSADTITKAANKSITDTLLPSLSMNGVMDSQSIPYPAVA